MDRPGSDFCFLPIVLLAAGWLLLAGPVSALHWQWSDGVGQHSWA